MRNVSVGRRYARALLELATEAGSADAVQEALDALSQTFAASPQLHQVFSNPAYTRAQRTLVLNDLLAAVGAKDPVLQNTLQLLNDRDRLGHLPNIARLYGEMADERAGRVRGQVTSAVALPKDALQRLEKTLESLTQRRVVLEARKDPAVLGGVAVKVGSRLFDGTLRSQLDELRRTLKG